MTHTSTEQPEALRLVEWIESDMSCDGDADIVAELRRQHARIRGVGSPACSSHASCAAGVEAGAD